MSKFTFYCPVFTHSVSLEVKSQSGTGLHWSLRLHSVGPASGSPAPQLMFYCLCKCARMCSGHTLIPFPLFCQVGRQNLTDSSTFSAQHHRVLALQGLFFFVQRRTFLSKVNTRSGSWISRVQLAPQKKRKKEKKCIHNHMLGINGDAQGRSAQWLIAFCSHGIRSESLPAVQMLNVILGFMIEKQRPAQRRKHMRRSRRV